MSEPPNNAAQSEGISERVSIQGSQSGSEAVDSTSESLYWNSWKQKIGLASDALAVASKMTKSKSEKSLRVNIPVPRNKSNASLRDSWWGSWKSRNEEEENRNPKLRTLSQVSMKSSGNSKRFRTEESLGDETEGNARKTDVNIEAPAGEAGDNEEALSNGEELKEQERLKKELGRLNIEEDINEPSNNVTESNGSDKLGKDTNESKWFSALPQSVSGQDKWWNTLWSWNSRQLSSDDISDENDRHGSAESRRAWKLITLLDNSCSFSWAFLTHDPKLRSGELAISGSEFAESPVSVAKEVPRITNDGFKCSKKDFPSAGTSGIITPAFDTSYRELGLRTKIRLLSRKLFKNVSLLEANIPIERHIYKESIDSKDTEIPKKMLVVQVRNFSSLTSPIDNSDTDRQSIALAQKWASEHLSENALDIELLSLNGKGLIEDQKEAFFNLLSANWIGRMSNLDFLLFSADFNSSPLAVHLLKKCFDRYFAIFSAIPKIGFVSVDGIWAGIYQNGLQRKTKETNVNNSTKKRKEKNGETGKSSSSTKSVSPERNRTLDAKILEEIHQYNDPNSSQSYRLAHDFKSLLGKNNVKISLIGTLNKGVPLYSSLYCQFRHPNINRMVYYRAKDEVSDFLQELTKACLVVRNLGYDDYNMLVYLADYYSKYMNSGASTIRVLDSLDMETILEQALRFCFETTCLYVNTVALVKVKELHMQTDDEEQISEGQLLRSGQAVSRAFKSKAYYINNGQDVILFHKVDYQELLNNFNEFQYPWILNKFVKELQVIRHIDVEEILENLREGIEKWNPKDTLSMNLKRSLDVIAEEDYL